MSNRLLRLTRFNLAAAIALGVVCSVSAQPPRPLDEEAAERTPAQPQADREPGYLGLITDERREQGAGA